MKHLKSLSLSILLSLIPLITNSQNVTWHKDSKSELYNKCVSNSEKWTLMKEQRETLCLCVLQEITKQYLEVEYQNFIPEEFNKIENDVLKNCAKRQKLYLNDTRRVEQPNKRYSGPGPVMISNFTKENVKGIWQFENSKIFFNPDGTYKIKFKNGSKKKGFWVVHPKKIEVSGHDTINVVFFDGETLSYLQANTGNTIHKAFKKNRNNFNWEDIVGKWKDENSIMSLNEDGTYILSFLNDKNQYLKGRWGLNHKKSIIFEIRERSNFEGQITPLVIFAFDGYTIRYRQDNDVYNYKRIKD